MKNVGHMNGGDGETSYATNSGFQRVAVSSALPVIDEALKEMFAAANGFHMKTLKMVDLGCSSGPNTLFIISHIIDAIEGLYNTKSVDLPEFEVYLNDLPENDFNNLFKLLPNLKKRKCFLYGLPGSFYDSLIPKETLHFAFSAYSIHWLSQIPEGLGSNNKENICMATRSPPDVFEAYSKQYQRDFSTFLRLRGNEIVQGGRMVLAFAGRSVEDPSCKDDTKYFTWLSATLVDMVAEGHVKMDDLYSFNVPMYTPCVQEVEALIQYEGSFKLDKLQTSWARLDAQHNSITDDDMFLDKYESGKLVANRIRAAIEPILASHFWSSIIDQKLSTLFHL